MKVLEIGLYSFFHQQSDNTDLDLDDGTKDILILNNIWLIFIIDKLLVRRQILLLSLKLYSLDYPSDCFLYWNTVVCSTEDSINGINLSLHKI